MWRRKSEAGRLYLHWFLISNLVVLPTWTSEPIRISAEDTKEPQAEGKTIRVLLLIEWKLTGNSFILL